MSVEYTVPKARWMYTTDTMPEYMVDDIVNFRDRWAEGCGNEFHIPLKRLNMNAAWVSHMLSEIPEPALDAISNGESELWVDITYE